MLFQLLFEMEKHLFDQFYGRIRLQIAGVAFIRVDMDLQFETRVDAAKHLFERQTAIAPNS
jgi:hypothetical protein